MGQPFTPELTAFSRNAGGRWEAFLRHRFKVVHETNHGAWMVDLQQEVKIRRVSFPSNRQRLLSTMNWGVLATGKGPQMPTGPR